MRPDTAEVLSQAISDLLPVLDTSGFHIARYGLSSKTGRFRVAYGEPVELIPEVLVEAVAAVTRVEVDFVHADAIAIAMFTQEHLDSLGPRTPSITIEELLVGRDE